MGVYKYISVTNRPHKRRAQTELYRYVSEQLHKANLRVIDLPSIDLIDYKSITRMTDAGLHIKSYQCFETNEKIYRSIKEHRNIRRNGRIRIVIRSKDVIECMTSFSKQRLGKIDLFNLDFCTCLTPTDKIFSIVHGVQKHMSDKCALLITFCPRGRSKINPKVAVEYAIEKTLPELYNISVVNQSKKSYRDTSTMCSYCYILEKEKEND